jgi:hypothetical protein
LWDGGRLNTPNASQPTERKVGASRRERTIVGARAFRVWLTAKKERRASGDWRRRRKNSREEEEKKKERKKETGEETDGEKEDDR